MLLDSGVDLSLIPYEEVPLILGRLDIFQKFSVEFREFENKIILKHQSEFVANMQG
jgi:hypothetical protein